MKKHLGAFLIVITIATGLVCLPPMQTALAQTNTATVVENANLRAGPGTDFEKVGSALAGSQVNLVGCTESKDWCKLADGKWIFAELLEQLPEGLPVASSSAQTAPATPTAPSTPRISSTPTPVAATPTRTPVPSNKPTAADNANLRAGPGTNFDIVGNVAVGEPLDITGKSPAGDWYRLKQNKWIAAFLVNGAPGGVPIVQAPTPTPTPKIGTESGAELICKEFVRDRLKAPSTASFGGWFDNWDTAVFVDLATIQEWGLSTAGAKMHGAWAVYGKVDAQNSFGAMIRSEYICILEFTDATDTWRLLDFMLE